MYDAGDRKSVRRAEKAAKLVAEAERSTILLVMSSTSGRQWAWEFLSACHIYNDPFSGHALTEAHSKGERNAGLRLLAQINSACPDLYIQMMREANERSTAAEHSRSPNVGRDDSGSGQTGRVENLTDLYDPFADNDPSDNFDSDDTSLNRFVNYGPG